MKNTNWNIVEPGQIVTFRYKSRSGRSVNRTVLCLDPEFPYRKKSTGRVVLFFIGLEIYATDKPRIPVNRLTKLFQILGTLDETPTQTSQQVIEKTYESLKSFLKINPIFKTYLLRKCRKNRVFLEDKFQKVNNLRLKSVAEQISKDEETTNILEKNLED